MLDFSAFFEKESASFHLKKGIKTASRIVFSKALPYFPTLDFPKIAHSAFFILPTIQKSGSIFHTLFRPDFQCILTLN